jgi:hypothetical protein
LGEITGIAIYGVVSATRDATKVLVLRRQKMLYSFACSALFVAFFAVVYVARTFGPLGLVHHH